MTLRLLPFYDEFMGNEYKIWMPDGVSDPERETIKEYQRALSIALNDPPTEPVDAVFLHPLSHGDDNEMFPLAAKLLKSGRARFVVINGSEGQAIGDPTHGKAWAGREEYIRRLKEVGVNQEDQIIVAGPGLHTRENNDVFLNVAKEKKWKTAVTLNQPQQVLRATLGQIRTMERYPYWMRLYSIFPEPWDAKKVFGSQGAEEVWRHKLLGDEYNRIKTYQAKGDLATFEEFFAYIKKRPKII